VGSWIFIENARIIDGQGNPPVERSNVLIEDDRIRAVGPAVTSESVPRGDALTRIDGTGKSVMPGLIDAHCHISFGEAKTQEQQDLYTSVELRTLRSAANAQKVLRAGVTSLSAPGGSYFVGVGIREGIKEGLVKGPRVATAGRFITTSNGLSDFYPTDVGVPLGSIGVLANTRDEMIREVRIQIKNGVDFVKMADSPFGDYQAFTDDEVKVITDLSHQLGKRATIHARGPNELIAAVKAETDWIMHGNIMTDEGIELLGESGIPLIPTLLLLANLADYGHLVGVPVGVRDGVKRMLEVTHQSLHKAREAGVVLGLGTDAGFAITPYGEWHARELELLMEYSGMTALEAIQAGTSNIAITMGLEGEVGVVAPGYLADLLVIDGNPADDITVLQRRERIEQVILGGKVVEFDEQELAIRRPYNPSKTYTQKVLTYDVVHGDAEPGIANEDDIQWGFEESKDLATDLRRAEKGAAATD